MSGLDYDSADRYESALDRRSEWENEMYNKIEPKYYGRLFIIANRRQIADLWLRNQGIDPFDGRLSCFVSTVHHLRGHPLPSDGDMRVIVLNGGYGISDTQEEAWALARARGMTIEHHTT